jgi:hypothetical protein
VLIDFQFFGLGNPAWELTYFLLMGAVDPLHDDMLLVEYHSHLIERGGEQQSSCVIPSEPATLCCLFSEPTEFTTTPAVLEIHRKTENHSSLCWSGVAASYSLDRLRNETMLTMGTMLVQMISESAHPGT